ncbi:NADAR family protein [Hydrogenophaga sp. 5NK40-0174]|uniref:NADAR family protein n=1 Tax=Hydrogenophaga sp. 5NK40-0174 TaxID=3127649 RepID=UPI0031096904
MSAGQDAQLVEELCARFNAGERLKFVFFWGHQKRPGGVSSSCFSQWYDSPFTVDGQLYPTAEHFMMAEKAALFGDLATRSMVLDAPNPGAAKALGRQVRGFDESRWLANRLDIVIRANLAKFSQNQEMGEYLLQTGSRILVEASPVDSVWGIGLAHDDDDASNPNLWRGLNLLGFALMKVRDTLVQATSRI